MTDRKERVDTEKQGFIVALEQSYRVVIVAGGHLFTSLRCCYCWPVCHFLSCFVPLSDLFECSTNRVTVDYHRHCLQRSVFSVALSGLIKDLQIVPHATLCE